MLRKEFFLLLLLTVATPMLNASSGDAPRLFAIGDLSVEDATQVLYEVDPSTGDLTPLVNLEATDCAGLVSTDEGTLLAPCRVNEVQALLRIDPLSGSEELLIALPAVDPDFPGDRLEFFDLARQQSGTLYAVGFNFSNFPGLPPEPQAFIYRIDPATGTVTRLRSASGNGIAFEPGSDLIYTVRAGELIRGEVDSEMDETVATLSDSRSLFSASFHPNGDRLFASAPNGGPGADLLEIEVASGKVRLIQDFPVSISGVAWAGLGEDFSDRVFLPIVSGLELSGGSGNLLTEINIRNTASGSVLLGTATTFLPSVQFFDGRGREIPGSEVVCPVPQSEELLGPGQTRRLQTLPGSFRGWAQITWDGDLLPAVDAEIIALEGSGTDCEASFAEIGSQRIQAQVRSAATRAGRLITLPAALTKQREVAVVIVNPSSSRAAHLRLEAIRDDGSFLDANEITIAPGEQLSDLLFELLIRGKEFLLPPTRPDGFRGQLRIMSDSPVAVGAIDLLLPEGGWAHVPVSVTKGAPE